MRVVEQLVYKITGDTKDFDSSVQGSEKNVSKFSSVASKALTALSVGAIVVATKKLFDMAEASAAALDEIDKMSQRIGVSREAYQEWDFILSQSGASVNGLEQGLKTLATAVDEADKGSERYTETFERLGIEIRDANGNIKDSEDLFNEVFTALADVESQTERTALANRLLGRSAMQLAPALNAGGDEIERMRNQAHDLGLILGDDAVDAGVEFTDTMDQLRRSMDAARTRALLPVITVANNLVQAFLGTRSRADELGTAIDNLAGLTEDYREVVKRLEEDVDDLSRAEVNLLESRRRTLEFEIRKELLELSKTYHSVQRELTSLERQQVRHNEIIDESEDILSGYTDRYKNFLKTAGEEGIRLGAARVRQLEEVLQAEANIRDSSRALLEIEVELAEKTGDYEAKLLHLAKAIQDGTIDIEDLRGVNADLASAIRNQVEVLEEQEELQSRVQDRVDSLRDADLQYLDTVIAVHEQNVQRNRQLEYSKALLPELYALREDLIETAKKEADAEGERRDILKELQEEIEKVTAREKLLKEAYDGSSDKIRLYENAIDELREKHGDDAQVVQDLVAEYLEFLDSLKTVEDQVEDTADAVKKSEITKHEALRRMRDDDFENFLYNIEKQKDLYLEAGVSKTDVEAWVAEQIKGYQRDVTENEEHELDQRRLAHLEFANQVTNYMFQMWGNINERRTQENNEAIQSLESEVEKHEEGTQARKEAEDRLHDEKARLRKEEAERDKEMRLWQARIDTAAAVIRFLIDPGGWAGLGLSAMAVGVGATQIGAIQAEPLPSFDVGTIRVPHDTQAVVHRDEMILPAELSQQARQEGISISPNNSRQSVVIPIYLDGRKISEAVVDDINSGRQTIEARVIRR